MKQVTLTHPACPAPVTVTWERHSADRDQWMVRVNGTAHEAGWETTGDGAGVLRLEHQVFPYHVARQDDTIQLWIAGRTHTFAVAQASRGGQPADAGVLADLTAPMPGTVRAVRVAQGDTFAAHDPLVVLESMKMEMTLSAPAPGQVTAVRCAPGDLVEMGATLLQLTEREDDGE
jgi:acetyl-CoA/propionyl-CoA carboxylase biotin carboxyl carrier protein